MPLVFLFPHGSINQCVQPSATAGKQAETPSTLRNWITGLHLFLTGNFPGVLHIMPHNKSWGHPSPLSLQYQDPRPSIPTPSLHMHMHLSHPQTQHVHPHSPCRFPAPHHIHLPGLAPCYLEHGIQRELGKFKQDPVLPQISDGSHTRGSPGCSCKGLSACL